MDPTNTTSVSWFRYARRFVLAVLGPLARAMDSFSGGAAGGFGVEAEQRSEEAVRRRRDYRP